MGKGSTNNPNLWPDHRLNFEYRDACNELRELVDIAKQVQTGTYDGPKKGLLNKKILIQIIREAHSKILTIEKYIVRRNEKLKSLNEEQLDIPLIKMNRNLVKPNEVKETENDDASFDDILKSLDEG